MIGPDKLHGKVLLLNTNLLYLLVNYRKSTELLLIDAQYVINFLFLVNCTNRSSELQNLDAGHPVLYFLECPRS